MENEGAQTSANWLSGGPFQRQLVPQATLSFGQPRPISRLGRAGRPYRPCFSHRPRLYTFFMYLSDVEEGGGTRFTKLNLTVAPAKGMAILWPSVLSSDV